MSIRTTFNLIMLAVIVIGVILSALMTRYTLVQHAKEEVLHDASIFMASASNLRDYTAEEVAPLLKTRAHKEFLPQTIPTYAAFEHFKRLSEQFPFYHYNEATLNPINKAHLPQTWEQPIVEHFIQNPNLKEYSGVHETASGQSLFYSRPIRIEHERCLSCHGDRDDAPKSMVRLYGGDTGFNWQVGQIVGAQIVSVPMSLPLERAQQAFWYSLGTQVVFYLLVWVLLDFLFNRLILIPISKLTEQAHAISLGQAIEESQAQGKGEIARLTKAFNRMHRSLQKALEMLRKDHE